MAQKVLLDDWISIDGDARDYLYQNDIFTTAHLCEKTFTEIEDIVGTDEAKSLKNQLSEKQFYLKGSDASVEKSRRFRRQKV